MWEHNHRQARRRQTGHTVNGSMGAVMGRVSARQRGQSKGGERGVRVQNEGRRYSE